MRRSVPVSALPKELRARLIKRSRGSRTTAQRALDAERSAWRHRLFVDMLRAAKLPEPVAEYRFWPGRKFAFDYAWPEVKVALEIEGAVYTQGRHTRGAGYVSDMRKYSEAAIRGWCLIRLTPDQLHQQSGETLIRRALASRAGVSAVGGRE